MTRYGPHWRCVAGCVPLGDAHRCDAPRVHSDLRLSSPEFVMQKKAYLSEGVQFERDKKGLRDGAGEFLQRHCM